MNEPLPMSLSRRWGTLQFVKQTGPHEWHSECPRCGDNGHGGREWPDRWFMRDDGRPRGYCRRCMYQDFADSDQRTFKITAEERAHWLQERLTREEQAKQEAEHAIALLRREDAWLRWHETMSPQGYQFWASKGVEEWAINYYRLGYCESRTVWANGVEYVTPTATIPIFAPGWELVNVRHRLVNPPSPGDKYRPDRVGLPSALFLTDPDKQPEGECILVEGEIKAIVLRENISNLNVTIVGLPGKNPRKDLLDKLVRCDRIHIVLDPDATPQAIDIAKTLGVKRARVVSLPVKPDDAFTLYNETEERFFAAIRQARVAA